MLIGSVADLFDPRVCRPSHTVCDALGQHIAEQRSVAIVSPLLKINVQNRILYVVNGVITHQKQ